ncbi:MAG: anti-sigma factor [Steroidobacteraceae bacterium]
MSDTWLNNDDLIDLLIKESTEGLSAEETSALEKLTAGLSPPERDELEHVAATAMLASIGPLQRMPDTTRRRVVKAIPAVAPAATTARTSGRVAAAGWWAAAACFALAVVGWYPRLTGEVGPPIAQTTPDPTQQREHLLQQQGTLKAAWSTGPAGPQPVQGDVVFDPVTQRGFLRFRGLPANDPRREQYQLWIADTSRSYPEPVDGGVFDVATTAPNGDVIIPFHAKLPVGSPAAFVITAEKPGGVVVSRQEKVLALAKVGET